MQILFNNYYRFKIIFLSIFCLTISCSLVFADGNSTKKVKSDAFKCCNELANASTIEEADSILKKYKITDVNIPVAEKDNFPLFYSVAISYCDTDVLFHILKKGANINASIRVKIGGIDEMVPIIHCLINMDASILECFLKAGANPNIKYLEFTPLYLAAEGKMQNHVNVLLKYGAKDPNVDLKNNILINPLCSMALSCEVELSKATSVKRVNEILKSYSSKSIDVNTKIPETGTPIFMSILFDNDLAKKYPEVVLAILKKGVKLDMPYNSDDMPPIYSILDRPASLECILKAGANTNVKYKNLTPLYSAASSKESKMKVAIPILRKYGAKDDRVDSNGNIIKKPAINNANTIQKPVYSNVNTYKKPVNNNVNVTNNGFCPACKGNGKGLIYTNTDELNTEWCDICNSYDAVHTHGICQSCGGTGRR